MRISPYFALASSIVILLISCQKQAPQKSAGETPVDYAAIQQKAEAFVPSVGKAGGEIILSTFGDPKSFNPITSTETSTSDYTDWMYEGLVKINGVTLKPEPGMAQSWEHSVDGLSWTFHIRPGVQWSDGTPFSAYDVEFTFNDLIYNDSINPNSSRDVMSVEGKRFAVKAIDSLTVEFKLPVPFAPFLRSLQQQILPKHKYLRYVKNKTFSTTMGIQTHPDSMVCNGPFMLESFISSQKVVMKRNPKYWQKDSAGTRLPYLDRVVFMIVSDQNAMLLRFKSGEVDFLQARGEDYPGLKREESKGLYTVYRLGPSTGSSFLIFNQNMSKDAKTGKQYVDSVKLSWFRNKQFRKAVSYALDRDGMIKIALNGLGYPQWGPMSPAEGSFFNPNVEQYPYDLAKAKEVLASAGFTDKNNDSILEDAQGHPVEFSMVTNSGNTVRQKISEIIRKDLEQLGFNVHFQVIEFNTLIQKIDNPPFDWDAIMLGLTGGPEPHFGANVWQSSASLHMWFPNQKSPSTDWERAIDSLFNAGVKELDESKRKVIYDEWQKIAADEQPFIYTVLSERIVCITNKFGNVNPSLNGGVLHNIEQLYKK